MKIEQQGAYWIILDETGEIVFRDRNKKQLRQALRALREGK